MPTEEVLQGITAPKEISPQAVQDQLQRLLDSSLFTHSRRYPSFLSYVVDQALKGRGGDLKERTIGIEVFGRKPEYDLAADPVVRQTAGEVRKRLAQYYYEPEHREELRIELHPGSYNPDFKLAPTQGGHDFADSGDAAGRVAGAGLRNGSVANRGGPIDSHA